TTAISTAAIWRRTTRPTPRSTAAWRGRRVAPSCRAFRARSRPPPHASCFAASSPRRKRSALSAAWRDRMPARSFPVAVAPLLTTPAVPSVIGRSSVAVLNGQSPALVKVTPLGSHSGELCRNDRAILFEDPSGVRILYDPGRTVDESDPRLGDVHVMLLSHAHTDHIGDTRPAPGGGTCAAPAAGAADANSNFVSIAAAKTAAVLAPGELSGYLSRKIQNVRGAAPAACAEGGLDNIFDVPLAAPCTASLRPGGSRTARRGGGDAAGVRIAAVQAIHSNGVPAALVDTPGEAPGLSGYGGSEAGVGVAVPHRPRPHPPRGNRAVRGTGAVIFSLLSPPPLGVEHVRHGHSRPH